MTAVKKTLLAIVQDILSDMDGEEVNSLSESIEAQQIATIVEHVFYDLTVLRKVPEHGELIKLTALSDTNYPTHFRYPDNVTDIEKVWYDVSDDDTFEYREVWWRDPLDFLRITDGVSSNYTSVSDKNAGTKLRIRNDQHPRYYTSFDDYYIVMDSHKSTVDTTLQESKVRAFGKGIPVFDRSTDTYIPDVDASLFPQLIAESRARAMDFLKGGASPKAEQAARRAKSYQRNDLFNSLRDNVRNYYGR